MFRTVFVLFLFTNSNLAANTCTKEGEVTRTLTASYKCTNGHLVPTGCLTKSGLSIEIDETAPSGHVINKCQKVEGNVSMIPIGCNINDHDLKPNEEYSDQNYYYGCTSKSDGTVVFETKGCIGSSGEKVPLGGTVTKRTYLYKCTGNSTFVTLEPYKCVFNSKQYSIGDTITDINFWSVCERSGSVLGVTLKGCVDQNGKLINPGEQFRTKDFILKCEKDGKKMAKSVIGCVENRSQGVAVDHFPGEKWVEPYVSNSSPQPSIFVKYLIECAQKNNQIGQNAVRCYFEGKNLPGGTYVDPGCMKKVGRILLKCSSGDSLAGSYVQNASAKDQTKAENDGLKVC